MAINNKFAGRIAELSQGSSTPTLFKMAQALLGKSLFEMHQGSVELSTHEINLVAAELLSIGTPNALNLRNTLLGA